MTVVAEPPAVFSERRRSDLIREARCSIDTADRQLLVDVNQPASAENWRRQAAGYWTRALGWRQLASLTRGNVPPVTNRLMVIAARADAERARELMRKLGLTR